MPKLGLYLEPFVEQHYRALSILKLALQCTKGARHRALEAVTTEYINLFKLQEAELFKLSRDNYRQVLTTEIHAQADAARRLSFETDWVWPARVAH